jgi:hypothetical protein
MPVDAMPFSDYIVYADESGDTSLTTINPRFPMFCLALCVVKKEDYLNHIVPSIQKIKFDYWGHDRVVLHEHEIRKQEDDFSIFRGKENEVLRNEFFNQLSGLMEALPYQVISATIDKVKLANQYHAPVNPYELALQYTLERLHLFLTAKNQANTRVHLILESRGKVEDKELELAFNQIRKHALAKNIRDYQPIAYELLFATKEHNATGLQLADLIARPIALKVLRPEQTNQAYMIIEKKFVDDNANKIFPE